MDEYENHVKRYEKLKAKHPSDPQFICDLFRDEIHHVALALRRFLGKSYDIVIEFPAADDANLELPVKLFVKVDIPKLINCHQFDDADEHMRKALLELWDERVAKLVVRSAEEITAFAAGVLASRNISR